MIDSDACLAEDSTNVWQDVDTTDTNPAPDPENDYILNAKGFEINKKTENTQIYTKKTQKKQKNTKKTVEKSINFEQFSFFGISCAK